MTDYKLVPVEPTAEMLRVWKTMYGYSRYQKYKAMLAAAPAVQGEPVDELRFEYRHPKTEEAYTVSLSREEVMEMMDQELFEKLTACFCECEPIGETNVVDCRCDEYAEQFELVTAPQPAEHQPDVTQLVEALEQGFPLLGDDGLDEVEHHCEWVIQRERKRVHSILAAYRKGVE